MVPGPFTSWQIEGEKVEAVTDFIFLGAKIAMGDDRSHQIKRHLLLRRKTMSNLDSILDITWPTKVPIVKHMIFPVVIYGCESWTIKKNWIPKNWFFWIVVLEKSLESSLDCKEIKLANLEEINPDCSSEGLLLKLKLQYFGYLMGRTDFLEKTLMLGKIEGKRKRGR